MRDFAPAGVDSEWNSSGTTEAPGVGVLELPKRAGMTAALTNVAVARTLLAKVF